MQINSLSSIPFQKCIKIPLKDKSMGEGRLNLTPMDKIFYITEKEGTYLYISEDVFVMNPTDKMKKELIENSIEFEEIDSGDES